MWQWRRLGFSRRFVQYLYVREYIYSAVQEKAILTTLTTRYLVCQTWTMRNGACICVEYNLVFWCFFGRSKIHHRWVPAHPEVGSWNMTIPYFMDNVTNRDQFLQICFHVYTCFHCWVTIFTRAAWQEEAKAHFGWKLSLSFYMFPLNRRVNIMHFFFFIEVFICWRQAEK